MNKQLLTKTNCIILTLLGSLTLSLGAANSELDSTAPPGANDWSFDLVPYLWIASYGGTFGLPNSSINARRTHSDTDDPFSTHLSAAAMLSAHIRYRDFGLFLDGAWAQLETDGDYPSAIYSGTEIKTDIAYGTAALTYRLGHTGKLKADVLAGARIWYLNNEIEFESGLAPGFTAEDSRTFADPIIGANLRYDFTRHWHAILLGDVGGFGVGSDLSWNVFGGVGYQFTSWFSATLGYRYLHIDYDKDRFVMDANVQGFLLGLGFHF